MNQPPAIDENNPVETLLEQFRDRPVFLRTLPGNNGDKLIEEGTRHCFASRGIRLVATPEQAGVIAINGGGAMNDIWSFGLNILRELCLAHAQTPLIVLPSSFYFSKPQPGFGSMFADRPAPVWLICRVR